jgi:NADH-quinone oxidoreductase subunit C
VSTVGLDPVYERLRSSFPDTAFRYVPGGVPTTLVPLDRLVEVARHLRETPDLAFDYLASITAIDYLDRFEVVYQLRSLSRRADAALRVEVDRSEPVVPSVTGVWRAADYQEREVYDLMGIRFAGHPDLRRILLYDEFDGHPLRKDWRLPAELPLEG